MVIESPGERLGRAAADRLAQLGCCEIEPGLSEDEFELIERQYGFEFADDHRAFLAAGLPVRDLDEHVECETWGKPWPDWRDGDPDELRRHLDWPIDDVLRRVELGGLWLSGWGEKPTDAVAAVAAARRWLRNVPSLVPVYAHRFLPEGPGSFGHPVMSVWHLGDIIYYGSDLDDWVSREFAALEDGDRTAEVRKPVATVPFWRDYVT
ncbi:hypothetical protein [Nocardia sp. CDC160]|uniref:hypothetical protein n=1 Tax=Nocardia sp. CDC160 TaxID=3112166 RepID=UPI002DBE0A06|nr:hypothetical protein [Nocardia sp. CDC160]MEC3917971.1 hypothetical protein [Nocardia sp. CDC160]